ncbi:MAG: MFS transporter [Anaerolineaceae bacterium]|nr:MFS transporter [Anaerolineaceae bacterium]
MTTADSSPKKQPLISSLLWLFLIAMVLANVAAQMYSSFIPLYLKSLGASVAQIGLFFTLFQIIPLILQILGGWISDSLGRLRSIAIGSSIGIISYFGLLWAPTWQWVFLGQSLNAITTSLVSPSFGAFVAEESSEENRARVYGITQTIFLSVLVIGPPIGGWLVDRFSFKFMLLIASLIYTCATVLRIIMARKASKKERETTPGRLSLDSLKDNLGSMLALLLSGGLITWLLITDGVRDIAFSLTGTYFPIYIEEVGGLTTTQIGLLTSLTGIASMIVNIPAGWLADKKGERLNIIIGFVMQFIALMIFIQAETFWGYVAVFAMFGLGSGIMQPAYQSLLSKAIPEKLRGTGFGLIQSSLGIFSLPAPYLGGYLYQNISPLLPFRITAWVSLLAVIPAWLKFKLPKSQGDTESQSLPTESSTE